MSLAGEADDFIGIGRRQFDIASVAVDGFLELGDTLARDVPDNVASFFPGLMVVIGPGPHRAKFPPLHPGDEGHLTQKRFGGF